jgi:transcriptional regulator with XRE-family HTH domain
MFRKGCIMSTERKTQAGKHGIHPNIGARLRELRQQQGFSIVKLASAIEVTSGLISQVENGLADPSLTTLRRISEVLRVPLFYFFISSESEAKVRSSEQRYVLSSDDGNVEYEFISDPNEGQIEFTMVRAKPGAASGNKQDHHPGRECSLVLEGRMVLEIEDSLYELNEGDSITFDSLRPHRWMNSGKTILKMVSVTMRVFG